MFSEITQLISAGFLIGAFFIFLLRRIAVRRAVLMGKGIPVVGGVAMGLSFAAVFFLSRFLPGNISSGLAGLAVASCIMLLFGLLDDCFEMSIAAQFLSQGAAIWVLILFGVQARFAQFSDTVNVALTFLWMSGVTSAFNHLDIIDGLAGGVALIVAASLLAIAFSFHAPNAAFVLLALLGGLLSFLSYNLPPAKIYMGNSGSHFLGFVLAATALLLAQAQPAAAPGAWLVLGFPIFDTAFVSLMRISKGISPFKKSNDHLALRLLAAGYSKQRTLGAMLVLCMLLSLSGVLMDISRAAAGFGLACVGFTILVLKSKAGRVAV